jgi:hypothetical protein
MSLSRDAIAAARDFRTITVPVPEWGGEVLLREMSVGSQDAIRQLLFRYATAGDDNTEELAFNRRVILEHPELILEQQILTLAACLCDEQGALLFDDPEGHVILRQRSLAVIERLYDAAMALNGQAGADTSLALEKKDWNGIPSSASSSGSAVVSAGPSPSSAGA